LEDLPYEFAEGIEDYNRQVTEVFSQYLKTVASELEKDRGEEKKLPLSGIEFPDTTSITDLVENDTIKSLARSSIAYSACSSFSALSGNSDLHLHSTDQKTAVHWERWEREESVGDGSEENEDESDCDEEDEAEHREPIEHLLKIIRQDVYTDMNVVPILPLKKANSVGHVLLLNAYALDFFKHGSQKVIERENGIKAGEVFFLLKDFYLTIKSISCSLEEIGPEDDNVVLAFKQLAREFGEKFNNQF